MIRLFGLGLRIFGDCFGDSSGDFLVSLALFGDGLGHFW